MIRSKTAWFNLLANATGVLFLGCISALFLLSYSRVWESNFGSTVITLLFAVVFGVLSLRYFLKILDTDKWIIADGKLEIKSFLGIRRAVIPLDEITAWWEVELFTRYEHWHRLTISDGKNDYHLASARYKNYYPVRAAVTMGKPQNIEAQTDWYHRATIRSAIFGFTFGTLLLCFGSALLFGVNLTIGEDATPIITGGLILAIFGIAIFGSALYILQFTTEAGELPKPPANGFAGFIRQPLQTLQTDSGRLVKVYLGIAAILCVIAPVLMRIMTSH